jgi:hypothetical protein
MTQDEQQLFGKMLDLVQGVELGPGQQRDDEPEGGADRGRGQLSKGRGPAGEGRRGVAEDVRVHWQSAGGKPEAVHTNDLANTYSSF